MNIRLIVPNCNRGVTPIVAYGKAIADIAGGFTASRAMGGWIDGSGVLVVELVTVFDCSSPDDASYSSEHGVGAWRSLAKRIACELHQQCVYLSIDGKVDYIS